MINSRFTKYAKYVSKQNRISVQRVGDTVYVCDGYTMAKMPAISYDYEVRTVSPLFGGVEDGERARYDISTGNPLPTISEDAPDLERIWKNGANQAVHSALFTPFVMDTNKKEMKLRYIICGGNYIAINEKYYNCISNYAWMLFSNGRAIDPVFALMEGKDDEMYGFMILPVRYPIEKLDAFLHPQCETA